MSGLATPEDLSREPSPDGMESDMVLMGPPPASSFLSMPNTEYKLSSKSAPGSPGGQFCLIPILGTNSLVSCESGDGLTVPTETLFAGSNTTKVLVAHVPSNGVFTLTDKSKYWKLLSNPSPSDIRPVVCIPEGHQFQNNRPGGNNPRAIAVDNNTVILQSSTGQSMPSTVIVQAPSAQQSAPQSAQLLVTSSDSVISRVYGHSTDITSHHIPVSVVPVPGFLKRKEEQQPQEDLNESKKQRPADESKDEA